MNCEYGPCTKCGYKTKYKQAYVSHMLRKSDCSKQRGDEWIINETYQMKDDLNRRVEKFFKMYSDNKQNKVQFFKDYQAIYNAASRLRKRIKLIPKDNMSADESLEEFDNAFSNFSRTFNELKEIFYSGRGDGEFCGMKAIGVGTKPAEAPIECPSEPPVFDED